MKQGWQTYTLGQVCDIARGGSPRPIKSFLTDDPNGIRWIKIGDTEVGGKYISSTKERIIKEGIKSSRYVKAGDFLLSNSMSFGRPYILKVDGCIHDGWLVIRDYEETFIQDFLYYLLLSPSVAKQFEDGARGSTVRNLNTDIVSAVKVNVPTKKSEQQRIVSLLDAEFAKIDTLKANAERNLQNAKDLFQAALKKELEPKEGWIRKKLNDLYDVRDGTHDSPKYQATGYPLVTSKNLRNGIVDMTNVKYISQQDYDKINERSKVDVGDVLFAMIGTIGNPSLVVEEPNYAIKNMALFKVPSNQSGSLLRYVLSSNQVLDEMHNKAKGSNQPFVSLGYLRNFEITIPQTLEEQNSLVCKLDTLDERCKTLQANYEKTIALCDDLKQALLRKAFNGEI